VLLELHSHTAERSPCSRAPAREIVAQAVSRNLQGVVLTDHHYRWSEEELAALRRDAGAPGHFLLLSGQEVSTSDLGHVLVFGAVPALTEGIGAAAIRARHPDAALVRAHPYRKRLDYGEGELPGPALDAVEIFSSNHSMRGNSRGLADWHRHRFTATAGTDAHGQAPAGLYPTQFDHPVGGIDELALEIRRGRCRPLLKEITLAGATSLVTEVVVGTKGESEQRPRFVLRRLGGRSAWARALRSAELMGQIAARGFASGRFRVPELLDRDPGRLTLIEEGIRGRPLFERLRTDGPAEGRLYLELAAGWLARLHGLRLALTTAAEFLERERLRHDGYVARFEEAGHPRAGLVRALAARVLEEERRIVRERPETLVQCHGDYHPKNLVVGQDVLGDRETLFVAAVDLEGSVFAPPAFDVGWFLAHYRHQFAPEPRVPETWPPELFLEAYHAAAGTGPDFDRQVRVFTGRAALSIAAYLVKLGLGGSEQVEALLAGAENAIRGERA
jgi:hypothetical protein